MNKAMRVKVLHIAIPEELYRKLNKEYSIEEIINGVNEYLAGL